MAYAAIVLYTVSLALAGKDFNRESFLLFLETILTMLGRTCLLLRTIAAVVFLQSRGVSCAYTCLDGKTIADENVCDFRQDCSNGDDESTCPSSCDFENGLCGWTHETDTSKAELMWTMWANDGPEWYHGPATDHTRNSVEGHYLYVDDTNTLKGQKAILRAPTFRQAARGCVFSFYYFVYGEDFGWLRVYQYTPDDDREYNLLTAVDKGKDEGTVGRWNLYEVEVQACAQEFRLSIQASDNQVNEGTGGFAIDDLAFTGCAYTLPPPAGGMCDPSEGQCDSSHCYPYNEHCDFTPNCCDGTDESQANCADYHMCDFEGGMCDWAQLTDDEADWTRHRGRDETTQNTGPTKDHTTRSSSGYYVYTESNDVLPGERYKLGSFYIQPVTSGCQIRFYYHMWGDGIGMLMVYTRTQVNGAGHYLWQQSEQLGNVWNYKQLDLIYEDPFQVVFEAWRGDNNRGDIALDDISFTPQCVQFVGDFPIAPTLPPDWHCNPGQRTCDEVSCIDEARYCDFKLDCLVGLEDEKYCPDSCSFDDEDHTLCYWSQDVNDDIDFLWYDAFSVGPEFKGPVADHSHGSANGHYLYVDSANSRVNEKARLVSPQFKLAPRGCTFSMWFYMFGPEYGDLEIKLLDVDDQQTHVTKVRDNLFDYYTWSLWQSEIRACTSNFQIVIETENHREISVQSGFAVDDLLFDKCTFPEPVSSGGCGQDFGQCASLECYPISHHCDMSPDCCDLTDETGCTEQGYVQCDFENGLCDWEQQQTDEFDWTWMQGGTPDNWRRTGPQVDHTTGTEEGWYIYTEASNRRRNGDRAILVSFPIMASNGCAMRFYYHMEGQGIGTLNLYTRTSIGGPLSLVWSHDTSIGEQWNYENLQLNVESNFEVIIEGVIGYTAESDIGLDDISFTPECRRAPSLPMATTEPPPVTDPPCSRPGDRYCGPEDGICVHEDLWCDGVKDCEMSNADEESCPGPGKNMALIVGLSVTFSLLFLVACGGGVYYFFFMRRNTTTKSSPSLVKDAAPTAKSNPPTTFTLGEVSSDPFTHGLSEA